MIEMSASIRVALYARVSGEEQKQGHTIDSQIAELKQFADRNGWLVIGTYKDEAWSGAVLARPALDRLRDDASKKSFEAVLINDVDRLARDVTHLGVIKRDLERWGIRVVFRKIPSENSPTHNLLVNILGSFAEFEREMIMDRTRRGRRHKVETRQLFMGCIPPYGYSYRPASQPRTQGDLTINPAEAAIVRQIYDWVDRDGLSIAAVTQRLGSEGLFPRKGGRKWRTSSVRRILRGTIYSGIWYYYKHQLCIPSRFMPGVRPRQRKSSAHLRPKDDWVPVMLPENLKIVPIEQWKRVQQQIERNRCFSPRNSVHKYLLTGLVRCGGCQSTYVGNPSHGRFEYRCMKRCKRFPLVSEASLNQTVWTALERAIDNPSMLLKAVEEVHKPVFDVSQAEQVQKALDGIRAEETRIVEAYRLAILTPEQLARELDTLKSREALLLMQEKESVESQVPATVESIEEACNRIRARISDLSFDTKREVIRLLLRKVTFEGDRVRVAGVIPFGAAGGIGGTTADYCARNPAAGDSEESAGAKRAENATNGAPFSLVVPLIRDRARAQAASRANLARANASLRRHRAMRKSPADCSPTGFGSGSS